LAQVGDVIMQVNGEPILSLQDAGSKLMGLEKSVVQLVVKAPASGLMREASSNRQCAGWQRVCHMRQIVRQIETGSQADYDWA
jgi:hypothetical protein